ncbi:peroxidase 5 [Brachypodium distachyon]|uniref:Peroxidase n=1 Tax=Brachypodium distachyon TaxID=15368 RepID=I1HM84_BRADI|nr:peroxidase 5 [Brachypodium distachyon]KQK07695.1 hypothetical protein BRADI_2g37067v3 [Brachypodium distachyon]|eukprot:XP_010231759.1 peroxidase 5 [Brachypodium distachyon]
MVRLNSGAVVLFLCLGLAFVSGQPAEAAGSKKDVDVEGTVRKEVAKAIKSNPRVGAALVRLLFHDCWVHGCDGSVLLDSNGSNNSSTEKRAENNIGLAGFDVIDTIKAKLGDNISCADIVVLAARDATDILSRGKIVYGVSTGRKDGVISTAAAADAVLPPSTLNFDQLKANFAAKNFTQRELVVLSGAHAIGVAHLSSFIDRLKPSTSTPISETYQKALGDHVKAQKKVQGTPDPAEMNNIRDMDLTFQNKSGYHPTRVNMTATAVLDNSYYSANLQNMVLFRSDWELRNDSSNAAGDAMEEFMENASKWFLLFGKAMAKLSELPAEGTRFEIRKNCRKTN